MKKEIEDIIYVIREQRVMLDADLAKLYGVPTKRLNEQLRRNLDRFPEDFAFQLTEKEWKALRLQFATSNQKGEMNLKSQFATSSWGGRRKIPYAFTEHGVIMLANVLRSKRAIAMSIEIVRAFIKFRQTLAMHHGLAEEVTKIKSFLLKHSQKTDQEFRKVWKAIEKLSMPPKPERRIGFRLD